MFMQDPGGLKFVEVYGGRLEASEEARRDFRGPGGSQLSTEKR